MFVNQLAPLLLSALLTSSGVSAPSEAFSQTPHEVLAWAAETAEAPEAAAEILLDSTELTIQNQMGASQIPNSWSSRSPAMHAPFMEPRTALSSR